ncbi:hypothetical protein OS493_035393 [Desmophyllum pertusum]|uniref:Uncharacterized protein n=1 Tax=Desmophyllum pertusum TaxID=174260 RepID=A0A9W9ZWK6_9CNID|nr:hypothetical protein OS493_035393 [Desmophyllum pertusum]
MSRFDAFNMSSVKLMAMSTLVALSFLFAISDGQISCTEGSCPRGRVCCGHNGCILAPNCVGEYCEDDSACSRNESCCSSKCANTTTCLGRNCTYDIDCSSDQSCCGSECRDIPDCDGYSCSSLTDCDQAEFCCEGICSKAECSIFHPTMPPAPYYEKAPFIVGTIVGAIVFGLVVSVCGHFVCRRQRTARGRSISEQPILADPPQNEEQQTITPPPYNPGTTKASEQSPPYIAASQGRSGGVNTLDGYGAVSNTSALPV